MMKSKIKTENMTWSMLNCYLCI